MRASRLRGYLLLCRKFFPSFSAITTTGDLRTTPDFLCGYLLSRLVKQAEPSITGDLLTVGGALILLPVIFLPAYCFFLLMPAIMLLLAGAYRQGPLTNALFGNRIAILVGEASYPIYLLQLFTLLAVNLLLRKLPLHFAGSYAVFELLDTAIMVGSGVLCFLYLEEPLRQIVRRFLPHNKPLPPPAVPAVLSQDTDRLHHRLRYPTNPAFAGRVIFGRRQRNGCVQSPHPYCYGRDATTPMSRM